MNIGSGIDLVPSGNNHKFITRFNLLLSFLQISTDNLPTVERQRGPRVATDDERKEFADLFDSDSDESDDDETRCVT